MNFLAETIDAIKRAGKTIDDIIFIGSEQSGHCCTWDEFEKMADFDYDNGYGGQDIPRDLIIVFADKTIMRRGEYDGSEWWEWMPIFEMPKEKHKITKLYSENDSWYDLNEIN